MSDSMVLSKLKEGQLAVVKGFISNEVNSKICALGILPGTKVEITNRIPFNGPLCISLDNNRCRLAIGCKEASCVLIDIL